MDTVISVDQTRIAYWTGGDGPPLVLVHGTTADHTRWRPVAPLLEPHLRLHAMDRRGRGGSGDGSDGSDYTIDREFEDVAAVVRAVATATGGQVDLLGHSYGGLCALGAARIATGTVRRLVLYEPPTEAAVADLAAGNLARLESLVARDRPQEVLTTFFREVVGMPAEEVELMRSLPAWPARVAAADTIPRELRAAGELRVDPQWYAAVQAPTLVLRGGDSPPWWAEAMARLAAALPDARIEVMPGQRHVAMDTAPELFAKLVLEFLTGADR